MILVLRLSWGQGRSRLDRSVDVEGEEVEGAAVVAGIVGEAVVEPMLGIVEGVVVAGIAGPAVDIVRFAGRGIPSLSVIVISFSFFGSSIDEHLQGCFYGEVVCALSHVWVVVQDDGSCSVQENSGFLFKFGVFNHFRELRISASI